MRQTIHAKCVLAYDALTYINYSNQTACLIFASGGYIMSILYKEREIEAI